MLINYEEENIMTSKIKKVEYAINKLLEGDSTVKLPEIQYGWSGTSVDVYLSGGNWQVREMISDYFVNSRKYRSVSIQNNNTKKVISFYLND